MCPRVLREWAGVLALVLVLIGGAAYAGDSVLELGRKNEANATTSLTNGGPGPALRLTSSGEGPSLAVSSRAVVPNLNAALLDGHRAEDFAPAQGSSNYFPAGGFQLLAYDVRTGPPKGQFYLRFVRPPGRGTVYVTVFGTCLVNHTNPVFLKVSAGTGSLLVPFGTGLTVPQPTRVGCRVDSLATVDGEPLIPVAVRWGAGTAGGDLQDVTIMVVFSPRTLGPH